MLSIEKKMKVSFITSGFPNGFTDEFIEKAERYLTKKQNFVCFASDFSAQDKTLHYIRLILDLFKGKGITFDNMYILDNQIDSLISISNNSK